MRAEAEAAWDVLSKNGGHLPRRASPPPPPKPAFDVAAPQPPIPQSLNLPPKPPPEPAILAIKKLRDRMVDLAMTKDLDDGEVADIVKRMRMLAVAAYPVEDSMDVFKLMQNIKDLEPLIAGLRKSNVKVKETSAGSRLEDAEFEKTVEKLAKDEKDG